MKNLKRHNSHQTGFLEKEKGLPNLSWSLVSAKKKKETT